MHKILIISDHKGFGSLLLQILNKNGKIVELVSYNQVNRISKFDSYYLVIFCDRINFQMSSGIAQKIRNTNIAPYLFLSRESLDFEVSKGFVFKNHDTLYIKSIITEILQIIQNKEEVFLNIRKGLNRTKHEFNIGKLNYNSKERYLFNIVNKKKYQLTFKENQLLKLLVLNSNKILKRETALNKIWGNDDNLSSRIMDVYISKLRKRLKDDSKLKIVNFRSDGFSLSILNQ
jgi:DNA-binding response OmpR family regulator